MKFLNAWSVNLDEIPKYRLFSKPFTVDCDIHLSKLFLENNDPRLTPEIKSEFQKMYNVIDRRTNILTSKYNARYKIGRRYPDCPEERVCGRKNPDFGKYYSALITQPRIFKNTIFSYHEYIDIDQKKGHPTILM